MQLDKLDTITDYRGTLVEAFKLPRDGQVFYVVIKPHETRGNHYHTRKTERFLVIYGSGEMEVKNRETGDVLKVETNGTKPMLVTVVPDHTHNITATDEGCILLVWVDETFDKDDPDTFAEEI